MVTAKRPRRTNADLVKAAAALDKENANSLDLAFYPSWAANAAMPYRDPGDLPAWGRRNGKMSVVLQPGMVLDEAGKAQSVGYPYGVAPRILMAWMSTEAMRTNSPVLQLGTSVRDFIENKLHMKPSGGPNGSITRVREQGRRLFRANFHIDFHVDLMTGEPMPEQDTAMNLNLVSHFSLWWESAGAGRKNNMQNSEVVLTQEFFTRLIDRPVPVDMGAITVLSGSALRLDIYIWLTYRMSRLHHPTTLTWPMLFEHFGSQLADTPQGRAQFRRDFIKQLQQVLIVYSAARVELVDNGIKLYPSLTHVPKRGLHELARNKNKLAPRSNAPSET